MLGAALGDTFGEVGGVVLRGYGVGGIPCVGSWEGTSFATACG